MVFEQGHKLLWRTKREKAFSRAEVVVQDEDRFVIRPDEALAEELPAGQDVIIRSGDEEYLSQVIESGDEGISLRPPWEEGRRHFRVDDVFPVVYRKLEQGEAAPKARVFSGYGIEVSEVQVPDVDDIVKLRLWRKLSDINCNLGLLLHALETADVVVPEEGESPVMWEWLNDIDGKLRSVLRHLAIDRRSLTRVQRKKISISAAGIRFTAKQRLEVGDPLELKILLPTVPPVGIVTAANVVRVKDLDEGKYDIALDFSDMEDDVRDEVIAYTLDRQREVIRHREDI